MKEITKKAIEDTTLKIMEEMKEKPFIEHFVSEGKSMWRIGDLWTGDGGKAEFDKVMLEESKNFTKNKSIRELVDGVFDRPYKEHNITLPPMSEANAKEFNKIMKEDYDRQIVEGKIIIQSPKPKHLRGSNYTKPKKRNRK